jgi:hypothetical protein
MTDMTDIRPRFHDPHARAQQAAEDHLAACYDALHDSDAGKAEEEIDYPDSQGPFCGCETCVVREVLHAIRPYLAELARAEGQLPL